MTPSSVSATSKTGNQTPSDTRTRMERFATHLPYEDFPLTPHSSGRWCKKNKGVQFYYGKLSDGWEKALDMSSASGHSTPPAEHAPPPTRRGGVTVSRLCDHHYAAKKNKHDAGELAFSSLCDYDETCRGITTTLKGHRLVTDLDARDFTAYRAELAKRLGPVALGQ